MPLVNLDDITKRCYETLELEASKDQKVRNGLMVPVEIEELLASDKVEYIIKLNHCKKPSKTDRTSLSFITQCMDISPACFHLINRARRGQVF